MNFMGKTNTCIKNYTFLIFVEHLKNEKIFKKGIDICKVMCYTIFRVKEVSRTHKNGEWRKNHENSKSI